MEVKRFVRTIKRALLQCDMTSTDYFKRRVSQGLCGNCGNPNDRPDRTTCTSCKDKQVAEEMNNRIWFKEHGICPRCHKAPIMGYEKVCVECKAYSTNRILKKRENNKEKYNEYMSNYQREQTRKRRELGICTRCGKNKTDGVHAMCAICRTKKQTGTNGTDNGKQRVKNGLCYWCGQPVKQGYKVCEKHYQMNIQKLDNDKTREAREKIAKEINLCFKNI